MYTSHRLNHAERGPGVAGGAWSVLSLKAAARRVRQVRAAQQEHLAVVRQRLVPVRSGAGVGRGVLVAHELLHSTSRQLLWGGGGGTGSLGGTGMGGLGGGGMGASGDPQTGYLTIAGTDGQPNTGGGGGGGGVSCCAGAGRGYSGGSGVVIISAIT